MPRRDGTGPNGVGPMRRGSCLGFGRGFGFGGRCTSGRLGVADNHTIASENLEKQAARLEQQATALRNLAKQTRIAE